MPYEWVTTLMEDVSYHEKLLPSGHGVIYRPITKNEVEGLRALPVGHPRHLGPKMKPPEWKAVIMGLTGGPVWGEEFATEAEALAWCEETWEQDILPSSRKTSWQILLEDSL